MLLPTGFHQDFAALLIRHNTGDKTVLRSILFNIFINHLDSEIMCIFGKYVDNAQQGGVSHTPGRCATIRRVLNRLKNWEERNLVEFDQQKYKILHPGWNNPRHHHTLVINSLERIFTKKVLMVLVDNELNMSQKYTLTGQH